MKKIYTYLMMLTVSALISPVMKSGVVNNMNIIFLLKLQ